MGRSVLLLILLLGFHICLAVTPLPHAKKFDFEFGSSYLNETGSASHLDHMFTPKAHAAHDSSQRSGIGIAKGPPDLQFGLAFTVPFVSLSTERLLQQVSQHRGYDSLWDLANVLKLNVGGLVTVAVAGIAALLFIPALLPKFGNLFQGGFAAGGGWPSNGFGGFFPGFLEQIVPGLGLNKPLGYGQTYDYNSYPYNNDYYGAPGQRSDPKSRALKDDLSQNGSGENIWTNVIREVRNTAKEFESCALYAMCERGNNFTAEIADHTAHAASRGRAGRGQGGGTSQAQEDSQTVSRFDDIFNTVTRTFGDELPPLVHMQKAFESGKNGKDCSKHFKKCPLAKLPIDQMVKTAGDYIFT